MPGGPGPDAGDFIFVEDICRGLMACAEKGQPGDVYNLATGAEHSIRDWATLINESAGNQAPITLLPRRDWDHSGKRFGSVEKAARELDFTTKVDAKTGIERTVAWTRDNLDWIESCMGQHDQHMQETTETA